MELKAQELRIGNLVNDYGMDCEISGVIHSGIIYTKHDGMNTRSELSSDCKPIPLTEEWLVKFGFMGYGVFQEFEIDSQKWLYSARGKTFELIIENTHGSETDRCVMTLNHVKYVHQLQNLYFALTGEELAITAEC